ncbi:hypothetical protein [Pelagicoccus sp. SDUM812003]|uniref:hypothetical protein n=1 Tax=Pelagicoccus sp. SDUM812003 TaxID=3041267 RepID=UPI00280D6243|nr:hypothetical protein [Pelagicoccus sp. SDUM812003]MDQ8205735.1 hypothetical protein [Pelagicoccus sp. SDUM812003]
MKTLPIVIFSIITMASASFAELSPKHRLNIDLSTLQVGNTPIGQPLSELDVFSAGLKKHEIVYSKNGGVEIGAKEDLLDYVFVTMSKFQGTFSMDGIPLALTQQTKENEILNSFGDPYWVDEEDNEKIYFYEYREGTIELQFEFVDDSLSFVTMSLNGVLSDDTQRKLYGVTKKWPPVDDGKKIE